MINHNKRTPAGSPPLTHAHMGFVVHLNNSLPEQRFEELLVLLAKNRGIADELAFLTHSIHPAVPLEYLIPKLAILEKRMERARQCGFRAGLNFLSTLGHLDESIDLALKGDFTPMTGLDGSVAQGSFCPNDERYREYIRQAYTLAANATPDFIWTSDDVCMGGHRPAKLPCFCPNCLRIFNTSTGSEFTRESIRVAFDAGTRAQKLQLRKQWIDHSGRQVHRVLALVEETVHAIKPGVPLGRMPTEQFYEGWLVEGDLDALSGPGLAPVKWRPGGHAHEPAKLLEGAYHLGRTVGFIPESETDIQSEIENFPYQSMQKPVRATVLQVAAHIAGGSTGSLVSFLTMFDESLQEYEPLIRALALARPFYDVMAQTLGRHRPKGFFGGWNRHSMADDNLVEGRWSEEGFSRFFHNGAQQLLEIGLPPAFTPADATVTLLSGNRVLSFEKPELERIFSGGVYMDASALIRLNELGYISLTGFTVDSWAEKDCAEMLTDDPLNGSDAGRRRDIIQSFWPNPCAVLSPLSASARILGRKIDRMGSVPSFACMGAYENPLGGRIVVAGYAPWDNLLSQSKATQIKRVFRWLSRDGLPGYVESCHKIGLWIRETGESHLATVLLNNSDDVVEGVSLLLRTEAKELTLVDMEMTETKIPSTGSDGPYSRFVIPSLQPWHFALLR